MWIKKTIACLAGAVALHASGPASAESTTAPTRPNILLIVADDLGYSDLGAFGGEIDTPNLDALARRGVRFTNYYTAPTCSPSRAMLLTGRDHHAVGMGTMNEARAATPEITDNPNYRGHLDPSVPTIAQMLAGQGYRTMMAGKWHLGGQPGLHPADRGFQQSYALMGGASDHFGGDQDARFGMGRAVYLENGQPTVFPVGQFTSDFFTGKMLTFLKAKPDTRQPFFAYMAFTAPHWPLQAPAGLIRKYRGRYDAGPAVLRRQRLARMRTMGLLRSDVPDSRLEALVDWTALSPAQRARSSRAMEVYAAMVDALDRNVGKLLAALKASGELDNTIIIFLSDNGAEGLSQEELDSLLVQMRVDEGVRKSLATAGNDPRKIGRAGSYVTYGPDWAQAGSAPFRYYKGFTDEGGVRVPAFITGPAVEKGRVIDSVISQRDIVPTLLALAGAPRTAELPQVTQQGDRLPDGRSLQPILSGAATAVRDANDAIAWELFFRRGIRLGDWKAVYRNATPSSSFAPDREAKWHLFNLANDPGESTDVSASHPDVLNRLTEAWLAYARANGVYVPDPVGD